MFQNEREEQVCFKTIQRIFYFFPLSYVSIMNSVLPTEKSRKGRGVVEVDIARRLLFVYNQIVSVLIQLLFNFYFVSI